MAKTAIAIAQSGINAPQLEIRNPATDALAETVTLTETATPGKYTGTITQAVTGDYHAVLKSGAVILATWPYFRVLGSDPSVSIASDYGAPLDVPRFGDQHKMSESQGDEIYVTLTDESV